jgi:hypothetical protein
MLHGLHKAFTDGVRLYAGFKGFVVCPHSSVEYLEGRLSSLGGKGWKSWQMKGVVESA